MTAMFLPIGNIGAQQIWAALFAADAGWLGLQLMRRAAEASHLVNHLLASVAMVYMFIAMPNHAGSGVGHQIALAQLGWLLAAYFLGYTVWAGLRLAGPDMASIQTRRESDRRVVAAGHGRRHELHAADRALRGARCRCDRCCGRCGRRCSPRSAWL